jgi:hypothetical protein
MSEVKRLVTRYSRDFDGNLSVDPNGSWVLAADAAMHAKKLTDELAALREELASVRRGKDNADLALATQTKNKDRYKQRAIAAEQRNADLCGLLVRTLPVVRMVGRQDHLCDYAMAGNIQAEIETTLNPKPTESGAVE